MPLSVPAESITEICQRLATHSGGVADAIGRMEYWPLFPLLDFPHEHVVSGLHRAFQEAGLSDADFDSVSLGDLVIAALHSESTSWGSSAVRWLTAGFPLAEKILRVADDWIAAKRGTQPERHALFRLIRNWERRSSDEKRA